ncbi:LOW QUALITY PROTEIN: uncharacterized protein C12orf56 homolog [Salvelinus alpinus]
MTVFDLPEHVEIVMMLTGVPANAALLWLQLKGGKVLSASKALGTPYLPHPVTPALHSPDPEAPGGPFCAWRRGSVLAHLLKRERVVRERDGEKDEGGREREAELHLYAVSPTSRIYLHLQSSWNSYVIRSTLLLDPLYRWRCNVMLNTSTQKHPPPHYWEHTAHLFCQLSGELLEEGISLESLYLLSRSSKYVKLSCVEEKLPPDYPISHPAFRLVSQMLGLIIQNS